VQLKSSVDVRDSLITNLQSDLMGPIGKNPDGSPDLGETLILQDGIPQNFYITGYLEPRRWENTEELDDSYGHPKTSIEYAEGEEMVGSANSSQTEREPVYKDEITTGTTMRAPSSIGLSTVLESLEGGLSLYCEWGNYIQESKGHWKRTHNKFTHKINAEKLKQIFESASPEIFAVNENNLYIHLKANVVGERKHLTCRLVNGQKPVDDKQRNIAEATIFQCSLKLECEQFNDARWDSELDTDKTTALLYHDSKVLARGHNVSVDWSTDCRSVWTEWMPNFEVHRMEEKKSLQDLIPEMNVLFEEENFLQGLSKLAHLVDEYDSWKESITTWQAGDGKSLLTMSLNEQLNLHVANIEDTIRRMREGIELLQSSSDGATAFMLANESIYLSASSPAGGIPNFRWRPFQVCFILLNICGLLWDENETINEDRKIVDLAWFPTGGGKTEAYLGLISTLSFYRVIKGIDQVPSVHSIMRYTLRLLTLNQGERATRLMVGMNIVAKKIGRKDNPFSIGMWIGTGASPNSIKDAKKIINTMIETGGPPAKGGTPLQLETCPWCNHDISSPNYWHFSSGRLRGHCPNSDCELHSTPVPFSCIDEEIYNHPPTLLIGTVDKFARLGSVPEARALIGLKTDDLGRRPPDLIIQDELHLLTGPLGSLAGLFETAIETLWQRLGHSAKYIAATATIRGAERDSKLMYGRSLKVFPPPGITVKDNFFAVEKTEEPGRVHIGVIGNIGHSTTLLEKPYSSLLQKIENLNQDGVDKDYIDPYWTLVGYFNSIRELSGAQSSVEDSINQQLIPEYATRAKKNPRDIKEISELFSRKKSNDLKITLNRLSKPIDDNSSLDICLTTNMFQVGIDVDRLGLMVINGQPKSNSEYIQASGRVGRKSDKPGLLITLLKSGKPRDLSHYEMHRSFHQEMYKHVDITTTTPFSPRAFDRAISSVLMLLLRQGMRTVAHNEGIRNLAAPAVVHEANKIIDTFLDNVVSRIDDSNQRDVVRSKVRSQWQQLKGWAQREQNEGLWRSNKQDGRSWAKAFENGPPNAEDILDSMRDVSEEIPYGKNVNSELKVFGTLPESHLFSHALPGGLWDKDGRALMTLGLNKWSVNLQQKEQLKIDEEVLNTLLGGMSVFRAPKHKSQGVVTVEDFPRNVRCSAVPAHISNGKRTNNGIICSHPGCETSAVPVRFVSLCSDGHLMPFNWNLWITHKDGCIFKSSTDYSNIRVKKNPGAGYTLSAWSVECNSCGSKRTLKGVTVSKPETGLHCNGLKPWINWTPTMNCDKRLSTRRRNSSSVSLPDGGRVLLIHPNVNWWLATKISRLISLPDERFESRFEIMFEMYCEDGDLDGTVYDLRVNNPSADPPFDKESFKRDVIYHRNRPQTARQENIRELERTGLAHGKRKPVDDGMHYRCVTEYGGEVTAGEWWASADSPLSNLSRVERLTEVQYLTGIRRLNGEGVQPLGEFPEEHGDWRIGKYNYGEGIYLGIKPSWLQTQVPSDARNMNFENIENRPISKELDFENPLVRRFFPCLHTFSHLLIKEICYESGYSLGSIAERLYLTCNENEILSAGILLYTTGSSSDGTLGGLSSQANRDKIERIVKSALRKKSECSNDPICGDHRPNTEEPNGSACHACVLLPESCCELGNQILDRNWEVA